MSDTNLTIAREDIEQGAFVETVTDGGRLADDTVKAGLVDRVESEYNHALDEEQTFVYLTDGDEEYRINVGHFEDDNGTVRVTEYHVPEGDDDSDDDSEDEPEVAADGGEDVTEHVDDATIEDAIAQHDDPDHEDATTVERVRDLLAAIQESAEVGWYEYVGHIEDGDWKVVAETDDAILLDTGETQIYHQEIDLYPDVEYRDDVERGVINGLMHELAADISDRRWPATYPLVVRKPDGFDAGQDYVEAVVNGLQRNGLSPGQAWAYYGVEIRGESRNRWGQRKGDHDHKNVSDALEKAKRKLP